MKRIRFIENSGNLPKEQVDKYYYQPMSQFIEMFLPRDASYCVVPQSEQADICMYTIQHTDDNLLRDNELNVFFCIEEPKEKRGKRGDVCVLQQVRCLWKQENRYFYHERRELSALPVRQDDHPGHSL